MRILTETPARDVVADPLAWWEKCVAGAGIPALVRILVAQAIAEDLTLASKDDLLAQYGVPVVW